MWPKSDVFGFEGGQPGAPSDLPLPLGQILGTCPSCSTTTETTKYTSHSVPISFLPLAFQTENPSQSAKHKQNSSCNAYQILPTSGIPDVVRECDEIALPATKHNHVTALKCKFNFSKVEVLAKVAQMYYWLLC